MTARAALPDGQALDVIVTACTRTWDGRWWYECEAVLPSRTEHADGATEEQAAPTAISVAAEHITPIPVEQYEAVPTEGAVAGRQWLAVRVRGMADRGSWWQVHRRDCWQSRGGWQDRRVTARKAAEMLVLAGPGAALRCVPTGPRTTRRGLPRSARLGFPGVGAAAH